MNSFFRSQKLNLNIITVRQRSRSELNYVWRFVLNTLDNRIQKIEYGVELIDFFLCFQITPPQFHKKKADED